MAIDENLMNLIPEDQRGSVEEFKDAGVLKGIDSIPDLIKQTVNLEKKLGERFIPEEDADNYDAFLDKLKAKEYNVDGFDEEMNDFLKDTFGKAKLSGVQAKRVTEAFKVAQEDSDKNTKEIHKEELEALSKDIFNKSTEDALIEADSYKSILSDKTKGKWDDLSSDVKLIFGSELKYFKNKYIDEDSPVKGDKPAPEDGNKKLRKLFNSKAYRDKSHPDHKSTQNKANELWAQGYSVHGFSR